MNGRDPSWTVSGQSVRGSSHIARDMPNEDAVAWTGGAGAVPLVFAVSDGHGSATSFRSTHGSRIAVDAACDVLSREHTAGMDAAALEGVKRRIVELWQTRVSGHAAANPLEPDEVRIAGVTELTGQDLHLAYGATLLAVAIDRDAITYLQIGDGDVLCVAEDGTTTRRFPHDASMALHETHSLCEQDADVEMRAVVVPRSQEWPAAILAATDGYLNSFASDRDFLQIGHDYLDLLRSDGLEHVRAGLAGTLKETSDAGSHDDITLAIAERVTASRPPPPSQPALPPLARGGSAPPVPVPPVRTGNGRWLPLAIAAVALLVVAVVAFALSHRGGVVAPQAPIVVASPPGPSDSSAAGRAPNESAGSAKPPPASSPADASQSRVSSPAYDPPARDPSRARPSHVDSKPQSAKTHDP